MTIRHLEIFVQVYREKSITRAAEKLYMTQPAVSVAIRELEKQYDVALFERLGRRLYVTGAGEALYARAVQMLEEFHGLEQGLERKTALRVGSSVTLGNFLLPRVAAEWQMRHPESPLQVTVANGGRLQQMLRDNLLDVAVIEGAVNGAELETRPFRQDRLVLVLPQGHPLTVPEHITLEQVLEYPLLVREEGSAGHRCLEQVLARRGLQADRRWESIDTLALLRAVAQGLGVAFLPRELAEGMPGVVIRTLADEDFCRENVLVWHRHKRLSAELLELMELLEK